MKKNLSNTTKAKVIQRDGYKCVRCKHSDNSLTVDHIIPLSLGGTHALDNLQTMCFACNSTKSSALTFWEKIKYIWNIDKYFLNYKHTQEQKISEAKSDINNRTNQLKKDIENRLKQFSGNFKKHLSEKFEPRDEAVLYIYAELNKFKEDVDNFLSN